MSTIHVIDHPLVADKLSHMRSKETRSWEFRQLLREITLLMAYEVTRDFETVAFPIETPLCTRSLPKLKSTAITIVPILRAGEGFVDAMLEILPYAKVGHIGLKRNEETHLSEEYYCKMPWDVAQSSVIIVDPMLATGGSACDAIDKMKERGCTQIRLMNLVAAPEGIAAVQERHPDVDIYVAAIDEGLNDDAYIVPGLGDAGDRLYGTD